MSMVNYSFLGVYANYLLLDDQIVIENSTLRNVISLVFYYYDYLMSEPRQW